MAIAAARNAMVYNDKLTINWTVFFVIISVVVGCLVNTMGIVGLLPIIALVEIALCNYCFKTIKLIKLGFIVNSALYILFLMILDFASAAIESFTALVGVVSLFRLIFSKN